MGEDGFFTSCSGCVKKNNCVLNGFKKIVPIEASVKSIELPKSVCLAEKSVHSLAPIIAPRYATDQRLKWVSSNEEIAVVNSKGRVVALSSGTATITAMTLRPGCAGIYYKCSLSGDTSDVAAWGIALSTKEMPNAENLETKCRYTRVAGTDTATSPKTAVCGVDDCIDGLIGAGGVDQYDFAHGDFSPSNVGF